MTNVESFSRDGCLCQPRWPDGSKVLTLGPDEAGADDDDSESTSEEESEQPEAPRGGRKSVAKAKAKPKAGKQSSKPKQPKGGRSAIPLSEGGRTVKTEHYNHATLNDMPEPRMQHI